MHRFGLKLWSNNDHYVNEAVRLFDKGIYQYIELYLLPGTENKMVEMWKGLDIPYIVHAPHFLAGLNLAKREQKETNLRLLEETRRFADKLSAEHIIVHPGIGGDIEETASQIKEINESRFLIENKPHYAIIDDLICNGSTPKEIEFILEETKIGFCLDIGHAFCAERGLMKESMSFLYGFLNLKPEMYHLTDGVYESVYDRHDHIGTGNYDIATIVNLIPHGKRITVETIKDSVDNLSDFEEDIECLRKSYVVSFQNSL